MSFSSQDPDDLLKRAYSLSSEAETRALYEDWSETYDKTMLDGLKYVTPKKTASLLAETSIDQTSKILDVGSGTGLAGHYLAQKGYRNLDALDFSPAMLAVAQRREYEGRPVYQSTLELDLNAPLAIDDSTYDSMICTGTFTHAHVGSSCLDELFRILKPGGLFACTVQKDVWQALNFDEKVRALAGAGTLRTRGMVMDIYFETDDEPQGWYVLWEKPA